MRNNLKNARTGKGFTQVEAAKLLGVSGRQYQSIESGTSNGSVDFWIRAKKELNSTIDFLLETE